MLCGMLVRSPRLLLLLLCCSLANTSSQEEITTLACDRSTVAAGSCPIALQRC